VRSSVKYFFALIVSVYLLSNIGIPVYYHYCGGELESVNAIFKSAGCCGEEEEEEDSDCCQNETRIFSQKSETSFNAIQFKINPGILDLNIFENITSVKINPLLILTVNSHSFNYHPPNDGRTILSSKSVLII